MATGGGCSGQKGRRHVDPPVDTTFRVTLNSVAEDTTLISSGNTGGLTPPTHTHKAPCTPPTRAPAPLRAGNTNLTYRTTWDAPFSKD
eukprot:15356532-Ditylum_brightwellii.AAC.1